MSRTNQIISLFTGALVAFLALAAFRLSFDALRDLAAANGIASQMAWLYPAIIDGAIIIFSLSVLQASLNRERTRYPWALVGLFTALSIGLNILHAPTAPLPRLLAAIPPIALFLSFELLMNQVKGSVHRLGYVQSLQELATAVEQKRTDLDALIARKQAELNAWAQKQTAEIERLTAQVERLTVQKSELQQEVRALKTEQKASGTDSIEYARAVRLSKKEQAMSTLLDFLTANPDASLSEIADEIGRSKSTAGSYVSELTENGRLHKNGHGWEVLDTPPQ
jgi:uncharacterized protein (UPF0335 family)